MSALLKQLEEQARALSAEERAQLAEFMLESLSPLTSEIESAWDEEIERRVAAFDRGEVPACAAEDVFVEVRRISLSRR
ncbi:addiction module protein [Microbulbifer litoralis]|uniref:addiction module protein n=1 Tax=Microbulbifer litoralis TaxID=2933965 RepID=UPI002028226E|nr:addiction module protein [Microbulbifer sp. GX H0434]